VLPKGIEINPQAVSIEKLAVLSWQVMQPVYAEKLETLAGKFNQAKAEGLGSDNLDEVIEAAEAGKVDVVLLEAHRVIASRLRNKVTGTFETTDVTQPTLDDQLDNIGELVTKMGGTVVIIPEAQMPSQSGVAAIFRY
jgi:stalled ribosome rescue protein Dom34